VHLANHTDPRGQGSVRPVRRDQCVPDHRPRLPVPDDRRHHAHRTLPARRGRRDVPVALAAHRSLRQNEAATEPTTHRAGRRRPRPDAADGFPVTVDVYGTPFTIDARPERIVSLSPPPPKGCSPSAPGSRSSPSTSTRTSLPKHRRRAQRLHARTSRRSSLRPRPRRSCPTTRATSSRRSRDRRPGARAPGRESTSRTSSRSSRCSVRSPGTSMARPRSSRTSSCGSRIMRARHSRRSTAAHVLPRARRHAVHGDVGARSSVRLRLLGLVNIADAADPDGARASATRSCPPSSCSMPIRTSCSSRTPAAAARTRRPSRPVRASRAARGRRRQRVIVLDDDVASRWGPRIVDFLEQVAALLAHEVGPR
jgi:hypothetical protein